jgi:copper(I)-binding protein
MLALTMAALAAQALDNGIVRAAPTGEDAAAYVAIGNAGAADRLLEVTCACAERVEIHRVIRNGNSASMAREPALAVPAGGVEIRPGSPLHLMLLNLRGPLAAGHRVPMTLRFERAGAVTGHFTATESTTTAWQTSPPQSALAAGLRPLAFLVGSCWRATFPNSTNTDTHCYTTMLGGRYIRDVHIVAGTPTPYSGEAIYRWDPRARRIRYDYYASDGGVSAGFADPTAAGFDFPEETYVGGNGETMVMRTVQTGNGEAYTRTTSARQPDGSWREMFTMRFTRVGPAPAH